MFAEFLSRVSVRTHESGMKIVLVKDPVSRVFDASIVVGSGAGSDPVGKSGLTHLVEHMCYRTNAELSEDNLKKFMTDNDSNFFSFTTYDCTVHTVACKKEGDHYLRLLKVLFQCACLPLFKNEEFLIAKNNLINEIKSFNESPFNFNYYRLLSRLGRISGYHSSFRCPGGKVEDVGSMTSDDCSDWHRMHYVSKNMTLIIHGDVDESIFSTVNGLISFYVHNGNKPNDIVGDCLHDDVQETTEVKFGTDLCTYINFGWKTSGTKLDNGVCDHRRQMADCIVEKMLFNSDEFRFSGHGKAGGHICRTNNIGWIICGSVINGDDSAEIEAAKNAMLSGISKVHDEYNDTQFHQFKDIVLADLNNMLHTDHVANVLFKVFASGDGSIENWLKSIQTVEPSDVYRILHEMVVTEPVVATTLCKPAAV